MAVATATKSNVIRNVKLIGFESRNGRIYPPEVLRGAVHLYEGAKVNVDHPERGPMAERKIGERIGQIKNVRYVAGSGLHGDFHYNPHHPMAGQIAWDAEHSPESLGFSHNASLRLGRPDRNGNETVESIVAIRSIDLVADPATTSSMFESLRLSDRLSPMSLAFRQLIIAIINDESLSMSEQMQKIKVALQAQQRVNRDDEQEADEESNAEKDRQLKEKLRNIRSGIESMQPRRESLSELQTRAELLKLTLARLEAKEMASKRFETGPQAKLARENYLRRFASQLKR